MVRSSAVAKEVVGGDGGMNARSGFWGLGVHGAKLFLDAAWRRCAKTFNSTPRLRGHHRAHIFRL